MDWAVILAGGSGTRFWPLSTPSRPKQLLPLDGERSTAEATMTRLAGVVPPARTLLVTGAGLAPLLQSRLGLPAENVLVEPKAAATGPALAWATHEAARRDPQATVLSLHADWVIHDATGFAATAAEALAGARRTDRLIVVGAVPTRPETGYGYIIPGEPLEAGVRRVTRFTEKPAARAAAALVAQGALWNSGLFAWTARRLLDELTAHTPEIGPHLVRLDRGDVAGFFAGVRPVTIDVGLLERSPAVGVVAAGFDWDDAGTWEALARIRPSDPAGNVTSGRVFTQQSRDCIVWSEEIPIVLSGVTGLVVVEANGRILVMPRERASDLKSALDALPPDLRDLPP